jgi:hypothetical protein
MKCPSCGYENRPIARYCENCGQQLPVVVSPPDGEQVRPKSKFCPSCGAKVSLEAHFCEQCGLALRSPAIQSSRQPGRARRAVLVILVGLGFLVLLGIITAPYLVMFSDSPAFAPATEISSPSPTASASASATDTPIPSETPTPTQTLSPTDTSTPGPPMISVSVDTNCRSGPGETYEVIGGLDVGEDAEVVARSMVGDYWVIKNPDYYGTCWLWAQYATIVGETDGLPLYQPPRTATPTKSN